MTEDDEKSSDQETPVEKAAELPCGAVHCSSTLNSCPTQDLGENATTKDFFNFFIDDNYLDEIVRNIIAHVRSKGDSKFTTNCAEISTYPELNILIGIHTLPQLHMYWDFDDFIGVKRFRKTIPKQRFVTLSKYLHIADPTSEDQADLLCKARPLVNPKANICCCLRTRKEQNSGRGTCEIQGCLSNNTCP